jgi:hypothetical protein
MPSNIFKWAMLALSPMYYFSWYYLSPYFNFGNKIGRVFIKRGGLGHETKELGEIISA